MMRRLSIAAAAALLAVLPLVAIAADLSGQWTTDGRYVFTFTRAGGAWTGTVAEAATGREFKLADIVVDGDRVSFFVVHDAAWDEEVQANGGRAFRNTASGTLTDTTLTISGARERTRARAYRATPNRAELPKGAACRSPMPRSSNGAAPSCARYASSWLRRTSSRTTCGSRPTRRTR